MNDTASLDGRLAIVTGARSPIGGATVSRLAAAGAEVIRADVDPADLATVDQLADDLLAQGRPIDLLIAADEIAGVPHRVNEAGIESQLAYNAAANALLASRLAPLLRAAEAGRFVILGSVAHQLAAPDPDDLAWQRRPYDPWRAYGASKTGAGLVALHVFRALTDEAFSTCVVHPGCLPEGAAAAPPPLAASPCCGEARERGGAALVWAATAPQAFARYSYADGAGPSVMRKAPDGASGHMPFIGDVDLSERLWAAFERHLGRDLPL